jgi:hypothetical protein
MDPKSVSDLAASLQHMADVLAQRASSSASLQEIVKVELARLIVENGDPEDAECPVTNIRDFIVRSLKLLQQLVHKLAFGNHVEEYADVLVSRMQQETRFGEEYPLKDISNKHQFLR